MKEKRDWWQIAAEILAMINIVLKALAENAKRPNVWAFLVLFSSIWWRK